MFYQVGCAEHVNESETEWLQFVFTVLKWTYYQDTDLFYLLPIPELCKQVSSFSANERAEIHCGLRMFSIKVEG